MATKNKKATSVAKKSKAGKSIKSNPVAKKAAAAKKPAAKKSAAKIPLKKTASKSRKTQNSAKPIKKQFPVKKAAKSGVKKAAPKKLAISKKNLAKKTVIKAKKTVPKKDKNVGKKTSTVKKPLVSKLTKQKKPGKVSVTSSPKTVSDHNAELKKAISKVRKQKKEEEKAKKNQKKIFVMPKTSTEKARKYEPEFTKSVLDQSPAENNGPSMRYSDNELMEFRELITRKLETAKKELGYLQGLITRKDQMGGDESDNRYMTMEDGSLSMEREQLSQMASRQITFIDHLEKAMMRIENKTYGICRVTGKLIDKARLRAVPHATLSIEAKMGIAK